MLILVFSNHYGVVGVILEIFLMLLENEATFKIII